VVTDLVDAVGEGAANAAALVRASAPTTVPAAPGTGISATVGAPEQQQDSTESTKAVSGVEVTNQIVQQKNTIEPTSVKKSVKPGLKSSPESRTLGQPKPLGRLGQRLVDRLEKSWRTATAPLRPTARSDVKSTAGTRSSLPSGDTSSTAGSAGGNQPGDTDS